MHLKTHLEIKFDSYGKLAGLYIEVVYRVHLGLKH